MKTFAATFAFVLFAGMGFNLFFGVVPWTPWEVSRDLALFKQGLPSTRVPDRAQLELACGLIRQNTSAHTLLLGSSRSKIISHDVLGFSEGEFINASENAVHLNDFALLWKTWNEQGRKTKTLIVMPDLWLFGGAVPLRADRILEEGCEVRIGESSVGGDALHQAAVTLEMLKQLFSFESFSQAKSMIEAKVENPGATIEDDVLPDGSHRYPTGFKFQSLDEIRRKMEQPEYARKLSNLPDEPDTEKTATFVATLRNAKSAGAEVFVITLPYHPWFFEKYRKQIEAYDDMAGRLAAQAGVKYFAGSAPEKSKCEAGDFYDAIHSNSSCLKRVWTEALKANAGATKNSEGPSIRSKASVDPAE